jgi:S-adenosylmethionine:tRNA-ribosyltransferase-isomerase (queuine synthetase)
MANLVNEAKQTGHRGGNDLKTVSPRGWAEAGTGWTHLAIDQDYALRITDGLLTGFHEPVISFHPAGLVKSRLLGSGESQVFVA